MHFMAILWPICGWFCGLICECLWHVQRMVLRVVWLYFLAEGVVWPDFSLFKGCLDCFGTVLWLFHGLFVTCFIA